MAVIPAGSIAGASVSVLLLGSWVFPLSVLLTNRLVDFMDLSRELAFYFTDWLYCFSVFDCIDFQFSSRPSLTSPRSGRAPHYCQVGEEVQAPHMVSSLLQWGWEPHYCLAEVKTWLCLWPSLTAPAGVLGALLQPQGKSRLPTQPLLASLGVGHRCVLGDPAGVEQ